LRHLCILAGVRGRERNYCVPRTEKVGYPLSYLLTIEEPRGSQSLGYFPELSQ
jgi:hypothetical protein